jgi:cytochrome c oxidase accessory protein FixG
MCPWPRIQTAMLDEKSLIVTYKDWRGEPRTQGLKRVAQADYPVESIASLTAPKVGDCIDCEQCVAVCPTGVDIRQGPQLGCITCALCIDACDGVMAKIGRPRGLIDYATLDDAVHEKAGGAPRPIIKTLLRPRTLIYLTIWASIGAAMLFSLGQRDRLDLSAAGDRNPRYVQLSDGRIRNSFTVKLRNMETRPRSVTLSMDGLPGAVMWSEVGSADTAAQSIKVDLAPDATTKLRLFVAAPAAGEEHSSFHLLAQPLDGAPGSREARPARHDLTFERPDDDEEDDE